MARIEDLCTELMEYPLETKVHPYKLKKLNGQVRVDTECIVTSCGRITQAKLLFKQIAGLIQKVGKLENRNEEEALDLLRKAYRLCQEGYRET